MMSPIERSKSDPNLFQNDPNIVEQVSVRLERLLMNCEMKGFAENAVLVVNGR